MKSVFRLIIYNNYGRQVDYQDYKTHAEAEWQRLKAWSESAIECEVVKVYENGLMEVTNANK